MFYVKCKSIQQVILVNSTPGPHDPRGETDIQDPFSVSTWSSHRVGKGRSQKAQTGTGTHVLCSIQEHMIQNLAHLKLASPRWTHMFMMKLNMADFIRWNIPSVPDPSLNSQRVWREQQNKFGWLINCTTELPVLNATASNQGYRIDNQRTRRGYGIFLGRNEQ